MRYFFLQNNNFKWKDILEIIEANKNQAFNSSIKAIPEQVWTPTKKKINTREIPKTISKHNKLLRTKQEIFDNSELKVAK